MIFWNQNQGFGSLGGLGTQIKLDFLKNVTLSSMILGFGGVQCFRALGWEQVFSLLFVHHFPCSNSLSFILVFPSSSIFCSSSS
jgi:hypothetical protein